MFLTDDDRQALMKDQWEREAQALLVSLAHLTQHDAWKLASSLYLASGDMTQTPEEAVREELSYWGE